MKSLLIRCNRPVLPHPAWIFGKNLHDSCSYDAYPERLEQDPTARGNGTTEYLDHSICINA